MSTIFLNPNISLYEHHIRFQAGQNDPYCCPLLRKIGWVVRDVLAAMVYQLSRLFACCGCKPIDLFALKEYRNTYIDTQFPKKTAEDLAIVGTYSFSYFGLWVLLKSTLHIHTLPPPIPDSALLQFPPPESLMPPQMASQPSVIEPIQPSPPQALTPKILDPIEKKLGEMISLLETLTCRAELCHSADQLEHQIHLLPNTDSTKQSELAKRLREAEAACRARLEQQARIQFPQAKAELFKERICTDLENAKSFDEIESILERIDDWEIERSATQLKIDPQLLRSFTPSIKLAALAAKERVLKGNIDNPDIQIGMHALAFIEDALMTPEYREQVNGLAQLVDHFWMTCLQKQQIENPKVYPICKALGKAVSHEEIQQIKRDIENLELDNSASTVIIASVAFAQTRVLSKNISSSQTRIPMSEFLTRIDASNLTPTDHTYINKLWQKWLSREREVDTRFYKNIIVEIESRFNLSELRLQVERHNSSLD